MFCCVSIHCFHSQRKFTIVLSSIFPCHNQFCNCWWHSLHRFAIVTALGTMLLGWVHIGALFCCNVLLLPVVPGPEVAGVLVLLDGHNLTPVRRFGLAGMGIGVIRIKWHPRINQILCSLYVIDLQSSPLIPGMSYLVGFSKGRFRTEC